MLLTVEGLQDVQGSLTTRLIMSVLWEVWRVQGSGFTYDKTNNVCTLGGMEGQEFRDCYGTLDFSNEVGR